MIIQGTTLQVVVTNLDIETGQAADPDDFQFTVEYPDESTVTKTYSAGQVDRLDVGKFRAYIDTSPMPGYYEYEAAAIAAVGVRERRAFKVKPAIGPT